MPRHGTVPGAERTTAAFICRTLQAVPTTCMDTDVVAGTTYLFQVTPVLWGVEGARSNEAPAKIPTP